MVSSLTCVGARGTSLCVQRSVSGRRGARSWLVLGWGVQSRGWSCLFATTHQDQRRHRNISTRDGRVSITISKVRRRGHVVHLGPGLLIFHVPYLQEKTAAPRGDHVLARGHERRPTHTPHACTLTRSHVAHVYLTHAWNLKRCKSRTTNHTKRTCVMRPYGGMPACEQATWQASG